MDISKTNDSSVSQGSNLILKIPTMFVNVPLKSRTMNIIVYLKRTTLVVLKDTTIKILKWPSALKLQQTSYEFEILE